MEFHSKLAGVTFNGRQANLGLVNAKDLLFWRHEIENKFDANAILVFADSTMKKELGHLRRPVAKRFIDLVVKEKSPIIICDGSTGGQWPKQKGLNIRIVY